MTARAGIALAAAIAGACGAGCGADDDPAASRCDGIASAAVSAADRKLLGAAAPYPADGALRGQTEALAASQRARRAAAWQVAARVLAPVALAEDVPAVPSTVPRWQTWYGRDDVLRLFQHLYRALPEDQQAARVRFADSELDAAFAWAPRAVEEQASWPEERWRAYLAGIDQDAEVGGIGGTGRASYSPGAARHMLRSYPEAVACLDGAPAAFADGPGGGTRRLVREPMVLAACARRVLGPYFVDASDHLRAAIEPGVTGGDATVAVRLGAPDAAPACDAARCEVAGPGPMWIEVAAGPDGLSGAVTVDYAEADPAWAACLDGAVPLDAAVVKADWRRADIGDPLPTYDTSAAGIARHLADGEWGPGDGTADPGPGDIYTVALPNGQRHRLAALHVMTKELDHWMWLTLWWSPQPDGDFGEDRPPEIAALGGPWRNYKMCAVTAFAERGRGDLTGTLGAAVAATAVTGDTAWCSNPYLELGHGNAASSCIGCHQHGGTGTPSEDILGDAARFPAGGRAAVRNNFPADYAWALDAGDAFAAMFRDEIEYWTSAP
jgi:hypothetical protein